MPSVDGNSINKLCYFYVCLFFSSVMHLQSTLPIHCDTMIYIIYGLLWLMLKHRNMAKTISIKYVIFFLLFSFFSIFIFNGFLSVDMQTMPFYCRAYVVRNLAYCCDCWKYTYIYVLLLLQYHVNTSTVHVLFFCV